MEKDIKSLVAEIILMIIITIIVIPICVNASHNYNEKKNNIQQHNDITVDINNIDSNMYVNINNYNKNKKVINLIMKTTKFSNEYSIKLDDKEYNLKEFAHTEDKENYYFNLGSYEIKKNKNKKVIGDEIYDDSITYSFIAEAANR